MEFTRKACEDAGIFFKVLDTPLYQDFLENFGERRTISIPWWTVRDDGHKSKMPRNCTIDYKVEEISKFVRWELLGYKKGQRHRPEDLKAHEMLMGFSIEESRRCNENPNKLFVNRFPLVDMGMDRSSSYTYLLHLKQFNALHQHHTLLLVQVFIKLAVDDRSLDQHGFYCSRIITFAVSSPSFARSKISLKFISSPLLSFSF